MDHSSPHDKPRPAAPEIGGSAQDPVCGMTVDTANPRGGTHVHAGATYYFCHPGCRTRFAANPQQYLAPRVAPLLTIGGPPRRDPHAQPPPTAPVAPPGAKVEYICPMDPEVVSDRPGPCPKCGMALEPRTIQLEEGPNPELVDMTRRFLVSVVVGFPVFALAIADFIAGDRLRQLISMPTANWVQLLLAAPVVLWAGKPFFERGWTSLVTRNLNMFTLIALGVGASFLGSSGNSVGCRIELEAATVEVDGGFEVLLVPKATGAFLDGLDF